MSKDISRFDSIESSAIGSIYFKNCTLEPNMERIGQLVAEIWLLEIFQYGSWSKLAPRLFEIY